MNKKILIVPDYHLRRYMLDLVKDNIDNVDEIIFLGDYLDPYLHEGIIFTEKRIDDLIEIINIKKSNPDKVVLLLGNHDIHYTNYMGNFVPCSRYNLELAPKISKVFSENRNLFRLFHKEGKYLFSHSGVVKDWVEKYCDCNLDDALKDERIVYDKLWIVGSTRGGEYNFGSCVWCDLREFSNKFLDIFQIFGHTQVRYPYVCDNFACLDCKKVFILDTKLNKFNAL